MKQKPLGVRMTERRERDDLTREDLALAFKVSVVSIRNWERGLNTPRKAIAEKLEAWLCGGRLPSVPVYR